MNGGTIITIYGYNFSKSLITDNAVQIGKTPCLVLNTTNERIICRTEPRVPESEDVEDVIVFLKTSEEAVCGLGPGQCTFNWISDTAQIGNIISYNVSFNELTGFYEIHI